MYADRSIDQQIERLQIYGTFSYVILQNSYSFVLYHAFIQRGDGGRKEGREGEKQATDWEKYLQNICLIKHLYSGSTKDTHNSLIKKQITQYYMCKIFEPFTKIDIQMAKKAHENMTNILPHYLKAKYKLKPKSVTITHLLERLKQNQKYFSNIKYQ